MATTYLPTRESQLLSFSQNMSDKLVADPAGFGLDAADATAYQATQQAFAAAYALLQVPETRTSPNVADKNTKKKALIDHTRSLVKIMQAWPDMTNFKRKELQITVPDVEPSPVPVPKTMPRITILSTLGRTVHFKVNDVDETRRGKPPEVAAAMIYRWIGENPPSDLGQWHFEGATTTAKQTLTVPADTPAGSQLAITALWVNNKMQPGPACQPVILNVAGGGVSKAA